MANIARPARIIAHQGVRWSSSETGFIMVRMLAGPRLYESARIAITAVTTDSISTPRKVNTTGRFDPSDWRRGVMGRPLGRSMRPVWRPRAPPSTGERRNAEDGG